MLAPIFDHVSPCFAYRGQHAGETDAAYVTRLAAELDATFERAGPDRVAAFVAETVVGATTGCVAAVPGYFAAMRAVCDRHGALLILDEVMSGMGRTGTLHAWEQEGVVPDIQMVAKGLAGGYQPIGGLLVARRVVEALRAGSGSFVHGQTYQAHPVACAAALEVQRVIAEDDLAARVVSLGERLGAGLRAGLGQHPHVGDIRGRGLFWAIELVADRDTKAPFDPALAVHAAIGAAAFAAGVAVYPMAGTVDGKAGDHVVIAPAYVARPADIDEIVERFTGAVRGILG
jgi:adenosylmethionine-8-amino-7-oxononanoate aminotransferase